MTFPYQTIYHGDIFQASRCIWHENTMMDFFVSNLVALGYQSVSPSNKVWQKGQRQVVVCLVDDVSTCQQDYSKTTPYLFPADTVVITDNLINVPTQYRVCRLPDSFFGIYAHRPKISDWTPQRRFCFAINRLDAKRLLMFLEITLRSQSCPNPETIDFTNFNCWAWDGDNQTTDGLRENFIRQFDLLESQAKDIYHDIYRQMVDQVPYRNHDLDLEQSHTRAWLNIVMETYSSDSIVAISEKIFRALCLPVPWMVYSGKHTVAWLNKLGFDVGRDLVNHEYDHMIENRTAAYGDKMVDFVFEATETVQSLQKNNDLERWQVAAQHNQQILYEMQQRWPKDFAAWWAATLPLIA